MKTYEHRDILNRLHQMQQSPYYATACHDLIKAEMAIVQLSDERDALREAVEHLHVQLAGCGVAAMQNTENSKAQRVAQGSYGYSESYADVCRAVDREIALRTELEALKAELSKHCNCRFDGEVNTEQCTLHNSWAEELIFNSHYRKEREELHRKLAAWLKEPE